MVGAPPSPRHPCSEMQGTERHMWHVSSGCMADFLLGIVGRILFRVTVARGGLMRRASFMLVQACWVGCTGVRVIDCPCSRAKHGAAAFHDFFGFFFVVQDYTYGAFLGSCAAFCSWQARTLLFPRGDVMPGHGCFCSCRRLLKSTRK